MLLLLSACRDLTKPEIKTPDSPRKSLSSVGSIVVYADSMRGWTFYDDQHSIACTTSTVCSMVLGPSGQPPGSGSAQLGTVATSDGNALIYAGYGGTRLDHITSLSYSTYRQSADAGNNLAIALQFNADFDLSDAAVGYQGRIVYEPYMTTGGQVTGGVWQSWNARTGKWWSTKASVTRNGVATTNPCVQSAPCTWTQLLARFPNLGIHATYGAIVLKAGSGWANFRGNVDKLTIGLDSTETTYDFEVTAPATAKHVLSVLADPGVSGTPAQGDSAYPMGTVVPYVFHGAGDGGLSRCTWTGRSYPIRALSR